MPACLSAAFGALLLAASSGQGRMRDLSIEKCQQAIRKSDKGASGYFCLYDYTRTSGRHDEVERLLRQAIEQDAESPWPYLALAALLTDVGKAGALEKYEEGIARFGPEDLREDLSMAHLNFAVALRQSGNEDRALEELGLARDFALEADHPALLRATTVELARHHVFAGGSFALGRKLLDELGELPADDYQSRINVLLIRSEIAQKLGDVEGSLAELQAMAALAKEYNDDYVLARALLGAANCETTLAHTRLSPKTQPIRDGLMRAHEAATRAGHTFSRSLALCALSEFATADAVSLARQCLDVLSSTDSEQGYATAAVSVAAALRREGATPQHRTALSDALARARAQSDPSIQATALEEDIRSAWATLPRPEAIARSLSNLDRIDALFREDEPELTASRRNVWRVPYGFTLGQVLAGEPTAQQGTLALSIAERQRNDDLLRTGEVRPSSAADIEALQAKLAPGHAVLAFWLGNDTDFRSGESMGGSWAWVVTADSIRVRQLPEHRALAARVRAFTAAVEQRSPQWEAAAEGLRETLGIDEALATSSADPRLTVVPDRELFELPFGALVPGVPVDYSTSIVAVSQRPSHSPTSAALPLAAFGDPVLPQQGLPREGLQRLGFAEAEVGEIGAVMGQSDRVRTGAAATETSVKAALQRGGVVHVAAHAVVNSAEPSRSGLVLTPSDSDDGVLRLDELAQLDIEAQVVVLSACESAAGPLAPGHGMHGLSQTLRQRGAQAVVGTLWPIRDSGAKSVFAHLYAKLAAGATLGEALAQAQKTAAAQGVPAQDWAALVVLGDGALRVRPPTPPLESSALIRGGFGWGPAAAGLVALGLFVFAARRSPTKAEAG